jgi:hypothetical protein
MRRLVQLLGTVLVVQGLSGVAIEVVSPGRVGGPIVNFLDRMVVKRVDFLDGYEVVANALLLALGAGVFIAGRRRRSNLQRRDAEPLAMGGPLILGPLYGAPARVIREVARRFDTRRPGILALAAAFALIQAGIVDQCLFRRA